MDAYDCALSLALPRQGNTLIRVYLIKCTASLRGNTGNASFSELATAVTMDSLPLKDMPHLTWGRPAYQNDNS